MKWMPVFMVLALMVGSKAAAAYNLCDQNKEKYNVSHTPREDVTHGENQQFIATDPVFIPVNIDMAERFNRGIPDGTELESTIGMMEIYKDGRILYDGKDISGDIKDACEDGASEFDIMLDEQTRNQDSEQ